MESRGLVNHIGQHLLQFQFLVGDIIHGFLNVQEVVDHLSRQTPFVVVFHEHETVASTDEILTNVHIRPRGILGALMIEEVLDCLAVVQDNHSLRS